MGNSTETTTRIICLVLCVAPLMTGFVFAEPSDQKAWLACVNNMDCTSIELGCWYWQPVNKKYIADMKAAHPPVCAKSVSAGPQPSSSCVDHLCMNDPYTVKEWKALGAHQEYVPIRIGLVSRRMDGCFHAAAINFNHGAGTWDYIALREPYLQQIDRLVNEKRFAENIPISQVIDSVISCDELASKAKALQKE